MGEVSSESRSIIYHLCVSSVDQKPRKGIKWKWNKLCDSAEGQLKEQVFKNNYSGSCVFLAEEINCKDAGIKNGDLQKLKRQAGFEAMEKRSWQTPAGLLYWCDRTETPGGHWDREGKGRVEGSRCCPHARGSGSASPNPLRPLRNPMRPATTT